jgi:hypothetical protein
MGELLGQPTFVLDHQYSQSTSRRRPGSGTPAERRMNVVFTTGSGTRA